MSSANLDLPVGLLLPISLIFAYGPYSVSARQNLRSESTEYLLGLDFRVILLYVWYFI